MATYQELANEIKGSFPTISIALAQRYIQRAWRDIRDSRLWTFNVADASLFSAGLVTAGTAGVTQYSNIVTADGTAATAWQGLGLNIPITTRQFRVGSGPLYNILTFDGSTKITLDRLYGEATNASSSYSIYKCFYAAPDVNFLRWISVIDPSNNYRLKLHRTRAEIDRKDPFRGALGQPYYIVSYKDGVSSGFVGNPFQVRGSGPAPTVNGPYIGSAAATYTVEVTTGGLSGTAVFKWRRDQGAYTTGVASGASPADLDLGVQAAWATGLVYVIGDVWTIAATPGTTTGAPIFELWPHPTTAVAYLAYYQTRGAEFAAPSDTQPPAIPAELIIERASYHAALWAAKQDPDHMGFWIQLSREHNTNYQVSLQKARRQDEETFQMNLGQYISQDDFIGPVTGAYFQSHDVGDLF